jgi:hypothetical protein
MSRWICTVPGRSVVGCTETSRSARATASFSRSENSRPSRFPFSTSSAPASSAADTTSSLRPGVSRYTITGTTEVKASCFMCRQSSSAESASPVASTTSAAG